MHLSAQKPARNQCSYCSSPWCHSFSEPSDCGSMAGPYCSATLSPRPYPAPPSQSHSHSLACIVQVTKALSVIHVRSILLCRPPPSFIHTPPPDTTHRHYPRPPSGLHSHCVPCIIPVAEPVSVTQIRPVLLYHPAPLSNVLQAPLPLQPDTYILCPASLT